MITKLTLFTATLVQDSALSVSGLDRESSADQPFALVDGIPTLPGRSLKGAAVSMAKRFFQPLPRAVSDDIAHGSLRRSAWEFTDAISTGVPHIRAGVGIRHKTGARATGVLYDREVMPAGTKWQVHFRTDWSYASSVDEGLEVEGILGYVLAEHWAHGRCWLGGGAARGLGWCHLEDLKAYRFDEAGYEQWVQSARKQLPPALAAVPLVKPTRQWCFRTLDVKISFGEYKPEPNGEAWGLDMFAIGTHDSERSVQLTGDGTWARPAWALNARQPGALNTDRAFLMDGARPLLPGASVRGPLRHAFSRAERAAGREVSDPHVVLGAVGEEDVAGKLFGTVRKSGRILIRDAQADGNWFAAKLHMHAEDEFSAGSYGSAKRDAVRLLQGVFPVRVVVEGGSPEEVEPIVTIIDRLVALGALGHLPIGGHKTRGTGWGQWEAKAWAVNDVKKERVWSASEELESHEPTGSHSKPAPTGFKSPSEAWVRTKHGRIDSVELMLGEAARLAKVVLGDGLVAWWCEPTIDLTLTLPPPTYGRAWPDENKALHVDEVAFYAERSVWRAVRTSIGARFVLIEELTKYEEGAENAHVVHTPAKLHGFDRFSSVGNAQGNVSLREWHIGDEILAFTLTEEQR